MQRSSKIISLICPFYNEEDSVFSFFDRLFECLENIPEQIEIVCVNDGWHMDLIAIV